MAELRDYRAWHADYDDPTSGLSWRLGTVRGYLRDALDAKPGPARVVSACAGDGRDIIGVLAGRDDADRVSTTLIEIDAELSATARAAAASGGVDHVDIRTRDAGSTDAYVGAVPADVVLLVGIFGNITDADVERTVRSSPQFCAPGAVLVWSRGLDRYDLNPSIRQWFAESGFVEIDYAVHVGRDHTSAGAMRYEGPPVALEAGRPLFTFVR
jgi:hypothetical protein